MSHTPDFRRGAWGSSGYWELVKKIKFKKGLKSKGALNFKGGARTPKNTMVKHLRWSFFKNYLAAFSCSGKLFSQEASS